MAIPHQVIVVQNLSKGRWHNTSGKAKFYEIDARRQDLYLMLECERAEHVSLYSAHPDVHPWLEPGLHDASVNIWGSINLDERGITADQSVGFILREVVSTKKT